MNLRSPIARSLAAAFLAVAVLPVMATTDAIADPPSDLVQAPAIEVFGQRPSAVMTPGLLKRLGGVEGTRQWVSIMVPRLELDFRLRQKLQRFSKPEDSAALNQLIVNTMLGKPLGVERSLINAVADLDFTAAEFSSVIGSVLTTCEETNLSYHDCNRILVSIKALGLYAREF